MYIIASYFGLQLFSLSHKHVGQREWDSEDGESEEDEESEEECSGGEEVAHGLGSGKK